MRWTYPHYDAPRPSAARLRRPFSGPTVTRRRFHSEASEFVDESTITSLLQLLRIHGALPLLAIQVRMNKHNIAVTEGLLQALEQANIVERLGSGSWSIEQLIRDRFR